LRSTSGFYRLDMAFWPSSGHAAATAVDRHRTDRENQRDRWTVARAQRVTSLSLALAAFLLGSGLWSAGFSIETAVAAALLLPVAFHGVPLAIEFIVGALIDRRPVARLGPGAALRLWLGETWRALTVFTFYHGWLSDFPEPAIKRDPARPAVLFVHGYCCNRAVWKTWIERYGIAERWNVATVNLEPAIATIDTYADQIEAAISRLRYRSGADRVTLVCHSMGGLVARMHLRSHGPSGVKRVITIGSPHHGTVFASCDRSVNARQMRRSCDFVQQLTECEEPVEFICFASHHDNLIVPRDSQVLDCAEAVWFERIGHLEMTSDESVLQRLIEVVERP
jgi:triacylglycerol lipase